MVIEWFVTWVATKAFGFLVETLINKEFVQDVIKDCTKDFFKNVLNNAVTAPFKREPLEKAVVMALTEFLQLMQQDLQDGDLSEAEIKKYQQPLKQFLKHQEVKEILGNAFKYDSQAIDTNKLAEIWYQLHASCPLPDDFNWKRVGRKYVQKVKEIILEVPELREILDSQNLDKIKDNTTEIAGIIPQFDLEKYQEGIRETYGNLKLDSLDTDASAYNKLKLWRIFIAQNVRETQQVLPQVYELPKEHLRRLRENDQLEAEVSLEESERQKQFYLQQPILPVLNVINKKQEYKYIVILGDPGSGKSTLLQYLALNWANSPLNNVISLPIPLLIELRTYMRWRENKEHQDFLKFFHNGSGAIHHLNQLQLHEQLKSGNALVMFDGLDEVFDPGQREDVITDIHRFTNEYPDVQVIVTSRVIGYKPQRLRDAEFHHFMLQDLDSAQIQEFIHRWHELTFTDAVDKVRKRERLQTGIATSKAITELAGNPLLLTMMAILNRNQELPRDRAELYHQASRLLLHQWDVERALVEDKRLDHKTIDSKDKQAMLRQVAYYMQTGDKGLAGNLISEDDLVKILTEYLKTIEVTPAREAARLMINQLRTRNFMLCFLGADYYAFVHRTFWEYFCASEFVWRFEKERSITIDYLKTEVFGKHWQDATWHELLLLITGMIEAKFVCEILEYLMAQDGEGEKFINLFLASECIRQVRNSRALTETASNLLNLLRDLTKYGDKIHPANENEFMQNEQEYRMILEIRTQAVAAIAKVWKDDPITLSWLKSIIQIEQDGYVRRAALQELARGWKNDPDTLILLKKSAEADDYWGVRGTAVRELARGWKNNPDTLILLKKSAQTDNNWSVRAIAVQELARGWKNESGIFELLWERAVTDPFKDQQYGLNPRLTALEAIIEQLPQHPQTLPLLRDRAENDPDEAVRDYAEKQLYQFVIRNS
jgi:predicted NACHT family NTPase